MNEFEKLKNSTNKEAKNIRKECFQNKSKFITEEYFTKHINIKTKQKHKLITKAINLIKLRSLGGETCWSN